MSVWIAGVLAGFFVALPPVGPLTLLFYRRLIVRQLHAAAALACIAALSDALYAGVAAFGYGWLVGTHPAVATAVRVLGIVLVAALGVRYTFFPPDVEAKLGQRAVQGAALQGLGVALLNPSALVTWLVVVDFARALGAPEAWTLGQKVLLPLSVAVGSATCFFGILLAWRQWMVQPNPRTARRLIRLVGVVLIGTAVAYVARA